MSVFTVQADEMSGDDEVCDRGADTEDNDATGPSDVDADDDDDSEVDTQGAVA